jgi:alpha-L-fucosidase
MNCVVLEEDLTKGQAISSVNISISINGEVQQTIPITTVGHQRKVFFPTCKATELSVVVSGAKNLPYLKQIAACQLPEKLLQAVL